MVDRFKIKFNKFEVSSLFGLLFSILFSIFSSSIVYSLDPDECIRIHILANSDNEEDQNLKLKVRDRILEYLIEKLKLLDSKDKEEALFLVSKSLSGIEESAIDEIQKCRYDYPVTVSIDKYYCNSSRYGDLILPAGDYDLLRVFIGEGKGKNFWCVAFPIACIPAATAPEDTQPVGPVFDWGGEVKGAFKIAEVVEKIKDWFKK
jgi:stage II sporulation protein R